MENELLLEVQNVVDEVCQKFRYNTIDEEGNESFRTVLIKATCALLKDSNKEGRELFYQMLRHTPIIMTENLTQESYDKLVEEYIGTNPNIVEENADLGEYGKSFGKGAYVTEPIFDENMNLLGKKSFIYIQKANKEVKELLGTDINVVHLIHELGHAWHAEKDSYVMQDDGTLKERNGFSEFIYTFSDLPDGKIQKKCTRVNGLMIEESMNTVAEEDAMARYMGISLDNMKKIYRDILVPSIYQGYNADFIRYMYEKIGKDDLECFRLTGNNEGINRLNSIMEKTDYWQNREKDIRSDDSPRSYKKKMDILNRIESKNVRDFFIHYSHIYFPDILTMTPLEKINNVLEQRYSMNMARYGMGIENYKDFLTELGYEGYSLINQAMAMMKKRLTLEEDEETKL